MLVLGQVCSNIYTHTREIYNVFVMFCITACPTSAQWPVVVTIPRHAQAVEYFCY